MSNATQAGVSKHTDTKSTEVGGCVFMDITSMTLVSLGGNKHLLVVVDDASGKVVSQFMKNNEGCDDQVL